MTPLHTLALYNAVANGGKMMKPYLVEAFCEDGKDVQTFRPKVMSSAICSKKTVEAAQKALRAVVDQGTAKNCRDSRYSISGKTGTAKLAMLEGGYIDKMGRKQYQASFAGYFPSERPKYSCIVVFYTKRTLGTYYGGTWAGPVFKKVADAMYASGIDWSEPLVASGESRFEEEMSARTVPVEKWKLPEGTVPDVQGMGLRDALYLLENEGYRVTFRGGGKVRQQTPEAGTKLGRGGQVDIILE